MKALFLLSVSILTVSITASETKISPQRKAFEDFQNYLHMRHPSGIWPTTLRDQEVSVDIKEMQYKQPLKNPATGILTGRCIVSICAKSGGHPANYKTDAYWDETTYQFIDHESCRYP